MTGAADSRSLSFGALLRRHREQAGLSQEELAEQAGVSWQAIGALERGERQRPYPTTVRRLADALGLSGDERAELLSAVPPRGHAVGPTVDLPASTRERVVVEGAVVPPAFPPLPFPLTPLLGRADDVARATGLLQEGTRLLTLIGPGGVGKTRLALQIATELSADFPDGVAFVHLAPLSDARLVLSTVTQVLGVREGGGQPLAEALQVSLREKRLLLVLDNCEHVLSGVTGVVPLLESCPRLTVLATSRAALRVRGEQAYPVDPLGLPAFDHAATLEESVHSPAVRLFVDRAQAASPAFVLTEDNASAVAAIAGRLDGLPLALELAAPRVKLLPPGALLARLHRALPLLTGGGRDAPARQQTMQNTIAWSDGLLSEVERALFRRLAIFAGGCTLEAAEAVCNPAGDVDILEEVASLVEQSLLRPVEAHEPRFGMLQTIREYATEQLAASGEGASLAQLHAEYYRGLAEAAEAQLRGPDQVVWLDRLETEHDNVRAALTWAREHEEIELGLRIASALWGFYQARGHLSEGRGWLEGLLGLAERDGEAGAAAVRAGALVQASRLARAQGDIARAATLAEEGLQLSRQLGDKRLAAGALVILGYAALVWGDSARAGEYCHDALSLAQETRDAWATAEALHHLGIQAMEQGDYGRAADAYEQSLIYWRACGDGLRLGVTLLKLGDLITLFSGDMDKAARLYEESLAVHRDLADARGMAYALAGLANLAQAQGDYGRAEALAQESLHLLRSLGERYITGWVMATLAKAVLEQGDAERASDLLRQSLVLAQSVGDRGTIAYLLDDLGRVARAQARPLRAARLCGAAAALRDAVATAIVPQHQSAYDRFLAELRQTLGEDAFALAWERGRSLSMEEAIADALQGAAD